MHDLERDAGPSERSHLRDVVRRGDLHDVARDDPKAAQLAEHLEGVGRRGAATHGGPGAGRIRRVEAVNVECEVNRDLGPDGRADTGGNLDRGESEQRPRVHDRDAEIFFADRGADADLHRPPRVDESLFHGAVEHRPVIDAIGVARPRVAVRVKVHECELPVLGVDRPEQRIRCEVISTKRHKSQAFAHERRSASLDRRGDLCRLAVVKGEIAAIDDAHDFAQIEPPGKLAVLPREVQRRLADRARPQPRSRAPRAGRVKRHAHEHTCRPRTFDRLLLEQRPSRHNLGSQERGEPHEHRLVRAFVGHGCGRRE
eukprot:Amastigsp_a178216_5.p2 type:complete len:314 gc:universal Amastigsp_a178216_5:70-1011(+)